MSDRRRTGIAAILAGALFFAGQGGELVFGSPSDFVDGIFIGLFVAGFVALGVFLWAIREVMVTRLGRAGIRIALAGFVFLALFGVQLIVELLRSGDLPDNFVLFALGFLLVLVGQLLFARDLGRVLGRAWILSLVAVAGLIVALTLDVDPVHDIGLFVFEGAWVGLGIAILRRSRPAAAS